MVKFDLPSLPSGSLVDSAKLHVYLTNVTIQNLASKPLQMHRITSSWIEDGVGGVTWNSQPTYDSGALDSIEYSALSDGSWVTLDVPVSVVDAWIADPSSNHGLLLKRNPDGAPGSGAYRSNCADFASSEASNASQRPKLEITYSVLPGTHVTVTKFQAETTAGMQGTFDTVSDNGTVTITGPDINPLPKADPFVNTWTFTITGADLDGIGGANDTMTVDMELKSDLASSSGATELISNWAIDPAKTAYFLVGPTDVARISGDEVVTFTPGAVAYTLNGGGPLQGTFVGFQSAMVANLTGGNATISGETIGGGGGTVSLPSNPAVLEASAGTGIRYRLTDIGFRLSTTPPEGADSDGDGALDSDEFIAGTDPGDPDSCCRVAYDGRVRSGRFFFDDVVSWPSVDGRVYDIQRSFDLLGGWDTVESGVTATPPRNDAELRIDPSTPHAVYRILVHWPDAP